MVLWSRFGTSFFWRLRTAGVVVVLLGIQLAPGVGASAWAQEWESDEQWKQHFRSLIRSAIEDTLLASVKIDSGRTEGKLDINTAQTTAKAKLTQKKTDIETSLTYKIESKPRLLLTVDEDFRDAINKADSRNVLSLVVTEKTKRDDVIIYVDKLLNIGAKPPESLLQCQLDSTCYAINRLSNYRFILGGAWAHPESGFVEGKLDASLLVRTRLLDQRGPIFTNAVRTDSLPEGLFVDLLVDGQFYTNQPFNTGTFDAIGDSATAVILNTVRSSRLSAGLFIGLPLPFLKSKRFHDGAIIGPVGRFSISSQPGTKAIFRRIDVGLRLENRSNGILREAAIEATFSKNQLAGSAVSDTVREKVGIGFERVIVKIDFPIRDNRTGRSFGLYAQFHGEWPIKNPATLTLKGTKRKVEKAPPVYQFRLGATFDPVRLVSGLLGAVP